MAEDKTPEVNEDDDAQFKWILTYKADAEERLNTGLLAEAAPIEVYEWLRMRSQDPSAGWGSVLGASDGVEDKGRRMIERVLYGRNDRLIDFALARFGFSENIVQRVFDRGNDVTKLAAMGNPAGNMNLRQADKILRDGRPVQLKILLQNDRLSDNFLEALFTRNQDDDRFDYSGIDDHRFLQILSAIKGNKRLSRAYDGYLDGWAEFRYGQVFEAAWNLAKTVPVDEGWAISLEELLWDCVHPVSYNDLEPTIDRWRVEGEAVEVKGWYDRKAPFRLRTLLATLYDPDHHEALRQSEDPALRMAFYRRFSPWEYDDWSEFLSRDGGEFINAALENKKLWQNEKVRRQLNEACWDCPDPHSTMDAPNDYIACEKHMRERYPEWFESENEEGNGGPSEDDDRYEQILKRLEELSDRMGRLEYIIDQTLHKKRGLFG
jgi:hypothetical protein